MQARRVQGAINDFVRRCSVFLIQSKRESGPFKSALLILLRLLRECDPIAIKKLEIGVGILIRVECE